MPVLVEHVVIAEPRDMVLEQPEAVTMDRTHEHRTKAIDELASHRLADSTCHAVLQLTGSTLGKSERDNGGRLGSDRD